MPAINCGRKEPKRLSVFGPTKLCFFLFYSTLPILGTRLHTFLRLLRFCTRLHPSTSSSGWLDKYSGTVWSCPGSLCASCLGTFGTSLVPLLFSLISPKSLLPGTWSLLNSAFGLLWACSLVGPDLTLCWVSLYLLGLRIPDPVFRTKLFCLRESSVAWVFPSVPTATPQMYEIAFLHHIVGWGKM